MALILRRGKAEDLFNYVHPYRAGLAPVSTFKIDRNPVEFFDNDIADDDGSHDFAVGEGDDVIVSGEVARGGLIKAYAIYNVRTKTLFSRSPIRNFVVGSILVVLGILFSLRLHNAAMRSHNLAWASSVIVSLIFLFSAMVIIPGLKTVGATGMIKKSI